MASSSTSTVAASTLTRPRIAVALASAIAAASLGYYYYHQCFILDPPDIAGSGSGLHRRNALRRPRRASQRRDESSGSESHGDENADDGAFIPLAGTVPSSTLSFEPPQPQPQPSDEWYNDPTNA